MKPFWTILKYFGYAAGSLITLYTAFTFFDGIKDDVQDTKEVVVASKISADSTLLIVKEYGERIGINEEAIKYNQGQTNVIVNSYLDYLKKDSSLTRGEFIEYMNPFLEYIKKNTSLTESCNIKTLSGFNNYVIDTEPGTMK